MSTTTSQPRRASGTDDAALASLRRWNLGLTVLHAAQAVLVLVLAGDFAISVVETFPEGPPGTTPPAGEALFDVRIGWAVAAFLLLAAVDHGLTATLARVLYERDLRAGINRFRWVESSLSATLMILLIASYNGITEVSAVIAIAGANVAMILFGWVQEAVNPPGEPPRTMLPFWAGTVAGLADDVTINPSGGALASNPMFSAGGIRVGEAARRIWAGESDKALAHATSGPALQQNFMCTLEGNL